MAKVDLTKWHKAVCSRDKYICQVCKTDFSYDCYFLPDGRNAYVFGHHLKSQKAFPELRLVVDNGICVCNLNNCHNKIHAGKKILDNKEGRE